jgi:hypothetical protein
MSDYFFLAAFSALLVTKSYCEHRINRATTARTLSTLSIRLLDRLDDTDSNRLSHVTDGESSKWWVFVVGLNAHWLAGNELDNGSITHLDKLGACFHGLARTTINLLDELGKLASNVGGVAIQDWSVTSTDLTGVI